MPTLNLCQFIGNIGKIDTRYTSDGNAVTNLSIGVNAAWNDKETGEKKTRTEWVRVSMFGKLAEIAQKYLAVGAPIYVSGRLQTRKWTDKEGKDKYTTEIVANELQMLGGGHNRESGQEAQQQRRPEDQPDDIP